MRNKLKEIFMTFYMLIVSLLGAILLVFNCTYIYKICIEIFNLESKSNISKNLLMGDYKKIISYVTNPFTKKLEFDNFNMSAQGEFHFFEVKNIVFVVEIIFIVLLVLGIILFLLKRKRRFKFPIRSLNYFFYFTIIIIGILLILIYFDFSYVFDKFHEMLFNNDYWVFNPNTDPIIKVLPEEFFMFCGVIILSITLIVSIISKIIYLNLKRLMKNNK